jgi:hypothetical protein
MGKWGVGELVRWGVGAMGSWGVGAMGSFLLIINLSFFYFNY